MKVPAFCGVILYAWNQIPEQKERNATFEKKIIALSSDGNNVLYLRRDRSDKYKDIFDLYMTVNRKNDSLLIAKGVDILYIKEMIQLKSTITCPECGFSKEETMPEDACAFFYECGQCHTVLKAKKGDCCVYCSYGTVKCPPVQAGGKCC